MALDIGGTESLGPPDQLTVLDSLLPEEAYRVESVNNAFDLLIYGMLLTSKGKRTGRADHMPSIRRCCRFLQTETEA